jgi:predicted RNA-binding Zn-ribbon protein involved in translation (DUF1610 family)
MPTAIYCIYNGKEISIKKAIELRKKNSSSLFLCVSCGEAIKPHASGGHTDAHFEHLVRNPECPLSHSKNYEYNKQIKSLSDNADTAFAIEGYKQERNFLTHFRNTKIVLERKQRDKYTCQACGFSLRINGRSIVECHHLVPLGKGRKRITSISDLITLCPNCHRIAHSSQPPSDLKRIKSILTQAKAVQP